MTASAHYHYVYSISVIHPTETCEDESKAEWCHHSTERVLKRLVLPGWKISLTALSKVFKGSVFRIAEMIRQQARLRREYIYRKSLEEKQGAIQNRRDRIKTAMSKNAPIPNDLRKEALKDVREFAWGGQTDNVDDEYRWAGCEDPSIVLTTSRSPSSRLKIFAKEMKLTIPNSRRINRGGHDIKSIVNACKANGVTDLILLTETRGVPDSLIVSHLPHGPTAYFNLSNVVMRHDVQGVGHMSEQYPHLIFHKINSPIGQRVSKVLKHLFPVPKEDSRRVVTFANTEDFISFRQHTYRTGEGGHIELHELGPRFEMRPYLILLGTVDNADACETEWALRSYINRKKNILSVDEEEIGDDEVLEDA